MQKPLRISAFGFRSIPPREGSAGADKFATELFPRLVEKGHKVTAYNRVYKTQGIGEYDYKGVKLKYFKTLNIKGFDTLLHSFKSTFHIILFNTGNIVHIQNGGNSIWALFLKLFGKKVFISQDGIDWKRDKWPWYGKMFLRISSFITAYLPNKVIFDNIYAKELFEEKFKKKFDFIPFGSEVPEIDDNNTVLQKLDLEKDGYFLFIGRFIPDKGLHYLIPAFEQLETTKKLVLVGGSPNPSDYEKTIKSTKDERVIFPGYIYGNDTIALMKNAYAYIQPSDIEGLSPVILTVMGLDTPIICSDIKENIYAVKDTAVTFLQGNSDSLKEKLEFTLENYEECKSNAKRARDRALKNFNWNSVTDQHIEMFSGV